jgi:Sjoegren syndrome nuclear autoantigen 1
MLFLNPNRTSHNRTTLQTLTKRLGQVNESLARKQQTRGDYEKVIEETDAAYSKIVESSHTLLNVLRKEASSISKRATIKAGWGEGSPIS